MTLLLVKELDAYGSQQEINNNNKIDFTRPAGNKSDKCSMDRVSVKHDGTVKMASLPVPSVRQDRWLRRDTQTRHADRTLKMARLPVPSAKKLGKYKRCCRVFQILLKIFCKQFTVLCIAHPA